MFKVGKDQISEGFLARFLDVHNNHVLSHILLGGYLLVHFLLTSSESKWPPPTSVYSGFIVLFTIFR